MKRSFFLLLIFTILLPAFAVQAQSALKNNIPFVQNLNTTRGISPFNFRKYQTSGPLSRNVYFGLSKLNKDHVSIGLSLPLNGITIFDGNRKADALSIKFYNKRGTTNKFPVENPFLSQKRHI